jgi:hypothetical protein
MNAHDAWLNIGSDGPAERDEDVFADVLGAAEDEYGAGHFIETVYNAYPALAYAMNNLDFHAKIDDEYASRVNTYEDPRDE